MPLKTGFKRMVLGRRKPITMTTVSILCLQLLLLSAAVVTTTETPTTAAPLPSDFLAYGSTVSDTQLSGDDRSSPRLRCFTTIPFLGTTHSYLSFSTNGLACLGCSYSSYGEKKLTRIPLVMANEAGRAQHRIPQPCAAGNCGV